MIKIQQITILAICFIMGLGLQAQMTQKPIKGPFLLKGGTIHPVVGDVFEGDILIQGGKISQIAPDVSTLTSVTTINCSGKHIYPGLIDAGTHLGLGEIGAVSLTNDFREIGNYIPQMQALTAVNPNSVSIPVTRTNGVTTVFTYPTGGTISGTGALIDLIGYTPEQMYAGAKAVIMSFPSTGKRGWWDKRSADDIKKDAEKKMKKLDEVWDNAMLYAKIDSTAKAQGKKHEDYKPELEALMPVVKGERKLFIEVNKVSDIRAAIKWLKGKPFDVVLTGVREGWRATKELVEAKIPVITGPILGMPSRGSDRFDKAYSNAGEMMKAGVKVAIRTNETENVRNLPFNAGFAAAYGMGTDEALKAITINTAEIFGVADQYGSLESGKMANLFICDGDPFETKTQISHLFIRGLQVPIESRHTLLYDEFLDRSPGLMKE